MSHPGSTPCFTIADLSTIISIQPNNADAYILRSRGWAAKHDCDRIIADSYVLGSQAA